MPSSLIDEHDCLRKWNKSGLVKRLGVLEILPVPADIVIVDVSQLFYHIVWPHGPSDLMASIQGHLSHYPDGTEKVVVFDKYKDISAKDHEIMRRAGEVFSSYDLSISSLLPKRDAILKSKNNKRRLVSVLRTFDVEEDVTMDSPDDSEAYITMVSYVLDRADIQCKVQMERWDGTILDINVTSAHLRPKCLQFLGMHALSGCDTTSYPYGEGKISALNTLLSGDFPGLADVLGEVGTPLASLMDGAKTFLVLCMVSCRKHPWSLLASHSSQGKLKVQKSWPCLQHPQI